MNDTLEVLTNCIKSQQEIVEAKNIKLKLAIDASQSDTTTENVKALSDALNELDDAKSELNRLNQIFVNLYFDVFSVTGNPNIWTYPFFFVNGKRVPKPENQ